MSTVDLAFDNALGSLRERYVSRLGAAITELKKFAVLCEFEETNSEIVESVAKLAHKLCGTGETLGFPEISSTASSLEDILQSGVRLDAAAAAAQALARACEITIGTRSGAAAPDDGAGSDLPPIVAPPRSSRPNFVTVHADPSFEKLAADICADRANVTNLSTCAEAGDILSRGNIDLLILDLDNPDCAADNVAALYKMARAAKTPMMAIASNRRSAAILHALSDGEIECLFKPVGAAALYEKALDVLERQRRIALLCDDDPVIREVLKPRFEARGFQVELAKNGDELLSEAERIRPSIIVLDRTMPGLDGLDVLKMLKANAHMRRIPVIMLTSRCQPQEIAEGMRSGAAAYMAKPFSPDQVLTKSLEILGMTKAQRG